jgi:hypothetical protein
MDNPEEPVVEEVAVVEESLVDEPVVVEEVAVQEESLVHEPVVVEEPVVEEVTVQEEVAVVEEPVVDEVAFQEVAVVEEPVQEESLVEEPVQEESLVEEQVPEVAVVEEPVVEEPVVEEQVQEVAVVEEPVQEVAVQEESSVVVEDAVNEEVAVVVEEPVQEELAVAVEEPVLVEEQVQEVAVVEEQVQEEVAVVEEQVQEEVAVVAVVVEEPVIEEPVVEEPIVEESPALEDVTENITIEIVEEDSNIVPKVVFIIPYRDRAEHRKQFLEKMQDVLEDYPKSYYKIIFAHQCDTREFNRGAMKNIGFLYAKHKYPNDYKRISFVFNDVDTMPTKKGMFNYETTRGNLKHFYGFDYALGGIISVTGEDFEKVNGFPNFWAWGFEDNLLNKRVANAGINIDRSVFFPWSNKNVTQLFDGLERTVNRREFDRYLQYTNEGLNTIYNISTTFDEENMFLNINNFVTNYAEIPSAKSTYDLRNGPKPFDIKIGPLFNAPYNRIARKPVMSMFR